MTPDERTLVGVSETRVRDGRLEGLCRYDDGSSEWRAPDVVSASARVEHADGSTDEYELEDVKLSCE